MELPHVEAARIDAAHSLAGMVRDQINSQPFSLMAIQVPDGEGAVVSIEGTRGIGRNESLSDLIESALSGCGL
jgi:hypothetical protein